MNFCFSLYVAASDFKKKSDICPTFSPSWSWWPIYISYTFTNLFRFVLYTPLKVKNYLLILGGLKNGQVWMHSWIFQNGIFPVPTGVKKLICTIKRSRIRSKHDVLNFLSTKSSLFYNRVECWRPVQDVPLHYVMFSFLFKLGNVVQAWK